MDKKNALLNALIGSSEIKVRKYVQDYVLRLDGIDNTREGHVGNFQGWQDLSGNDIDFYKSQGSGIISFNDNSLVLTSTNTQKLDVVSTILNGKSNATVEIYLYSSSVRGNIFTFRNNETSIFTAYSMYGARITASFRKTNELTFNSTLYNYSPPSKYHVSMTFNGDTNKVNIYYNYDVFRESATVNASLIRELLNGSNFCLGLSDDRALNGNIFALRIYDRVLNNIELKNNYELDLERFGE